MRSPHRFFIAALAIISWTHVCEGGVPGDVVVGWNERVLAVAEAEDRFLTLKGLRAAAMMHLAMHDALNSIERRYDTYAFETDGQGADPVAAAVQAAYTVAMDQYPAQVEQWNEELRDDLAAIADGRAKRKGMEIGKASATAILAMRAGDGWNTEATYKWQPMAPGVYAEFAEHSGTPKGFVFGAGWAMVKPFALSAPSQFRSPPPPSIESDAYTRAYDEVQELGRFESKSRTPDQTHLAMWWKDFAENSHNRLARQLVSAEHSDLWVAARLFALLNVSIMDSYISVFDNKFHYNHWRPYTAIRWGEHDGNPRTVGESTWDNTHRHTYAFPSYPSAHGTACAAAMTVLAQTYGDHYAFTMYTPVVDSSGPTSPKVALDPPTRSFESFSSAAMECALSRVYLGIHFRYDSIEGNRLGRRVGEYVTKHVGRRPRPVAGHQRRYFDFFFDFLAGNKRALTACVRRAS
jgi:membrane-associated phospholipid phosphatase